MPTSIKIPGSTWSFPPLSPDTDTRCDLILDASSIKSDQTISVVINDDNNVPLMDNDELVDLDGLDAVNVGDVAVDSRFDVVPAVSGGGG